MVLTQTMSHQNSPGSATPDTVHRGRRWRTLRSRHSAEYCCTTCTPWDGWCSWHRWCAESRASYRFERFDSVDSLSNNTTAGFKDDGRKEVISRDLHSVTIIIRVKLIITSSSVSKENHNHFVWRRKQSPQFESVLWINFFTKTILPLPFHLSSFPLTSRFFTDEAVGGGRAGVGLETGHLRLLHVGTKSRIAGLSRQPSQAGVGEGWQVFPAPVWHVDLPQPNPGR